MPVLEAMPGIKWTQITHNQCNGGEVVAFITLDKRELRFGCKKCKIVWTEISGNFPDHIFKLHGVEKNKIIKPPTNFKM